jgi:hypothetical protein
MRLGLGRVVVLSFVLVVVVLGVCVLVGRCVLVRLFGCMVRRGGGRVRGWCLRVCRCGCRGRVAIRVRCGGLVLFGRGGLLLGCRLGSGSIPILRGFLGRIRLGFLGMRG